MSVEFGGFVDLISWGYFIDIGYTIKILWYQIDSVSLLLLVLVEQAQNDEIKRE